MPTNKAPRLIGVWAAALLLAACGGGGGESSVGAGDGASDSGAETADGTSDVSAERTFDASQLPTTPLDPALLTSDGTSAPSGDAALDFESIVDECSVIEAATVTSIVSNASALGSGYDFVAEPSGRASCNFTSDTHRVEIFVNRADVLDGTVMDALNGFGGEVTTAPGGTGGAATLYFEDSFDIVTFYAARAEGNGWAAIVKNSGGTGLLGLEEDQDGWGDLALAALDGVADSEPADGSAVAPSEDAPRTDPCAVYEAADLAAAFDIGFEESAAAEAECFWTSDDESVAVGLFVGPGSEGPDWFGATDSIGDDLYRSEFGNEAVFAGNGQLYRLTVYVRTEAYGLGPYEFGGVRDRDTQPMVEAMIANIVERTS